MDDDEAVEVDTIGAVYVHQWFLSYLTQTVVRWEREEPWRYN